MQSERLLLKLPQLLKIASPPASRALFIWLLMATHAITTSLYAFLLGPLLTFLVSGDTASFGTDLSLKSLSFPAKIWHIPLILVAVAAVKNLAHYLYTIKLDTLAEDIALQLRKDLFKRLTRWDWRTSRKHRGGDLVSRFGQDVEVLQQGITSGFLAWGRDSLTLLGLAGLALYLEPKLALFAFTLLPVSIIPMITLGKRMRRWRKKSQTSQGAVAASFNEAFQHQILLRHPGARQRELSRMTHALEETREARIRAHRVKAINHPLMELLGVIGLAGAILLGAWQIDTHDLNAASFISFFAALIMLYEPLKGLSRSHASLQEAAASLDRLNLLLDAPFQAPKPALPKLKDGISLKEAHLALDGTTILCGATMEVGAGETLVLSGASGEGKTSLLRALSGLLPLDKGRLLWDETPLYEASIDSLGARIALLDQDAPSFGRTIRENLSLDRELDEDTLWAALERASLDHLVRQRGGLDAPLQELARDLSGGERRRLSLARVLLSKPDLVLVDEPLAALDADTERDILESLKAHAEGTTLVIVTHTPERFHWADTHRVLQQGQLLVQPTPEETQ